MSPFSDLTNDEIFILKPNGERVGPDVPPILSSAAIWSPIPQQKEIGHEEAVFGRADHRFFA